MSLRHPLLRGLGLAVAVIVLMAATQLLLLSFETDPLISEERLADFTGWLENRPRAGIGMLAGIALVALAITLGWAIIRTFGVDRRVITTRREHGWTKLDRPTLEDAIERRLEAVDRRNDVKVNVDRRGKVNLAITTPDPTSTGPVQELREALDTVCEERALPCHSGRITATAPRRLTNRRRIR